MLVRRDADDIREIRPRTALGALVVVCAMLVLLARLYQLQIARGDDYYAQSISNYRKSLPVPADRGLIKDRRGTILVENRPSFDVYLTPAFCKGKAKDEVFEKLTGYLRMEADDVERMKRDYDKSVQSADRLERFKPYLVALDIPRDQVDELESHKGELSCIDLIPEPHRSYKAGQSMGHILGYMSEVTPEEIEGTANLDDPADRFRRGQTIGRRGLERRYDRDLRGREGKENVAVDAQGRRLDEQANQLLIPEDERLVPSKPGNTLVLSIDNRLQELADQAFPGRAGAVVVMEAKTGFVLAMVSRPSYDPNKMSLRISRAEMTALNEDPLKPLINRAMNENYHPGSTFKPVVGMAALERGVITPSGIVNCPGRFTMGNHTWRCDKPSGHGPMDLKRGLQFSCDVYFYALGERLGIEPIADMARQLGYGAPTNLDLGRENGGIIPDTESIVKTYGAYTKGFAVNASIGQGDVNVTPLQQAVAYAAIANGGTVFRPQLVRRIETWDGQTVKEFPPLIERKLEFKPGTLDTVRAGLLAVVSSPGGTAYGVRSQEVSFAGKTGTAQVVALGARQKLKPEEQAFLSRDHAWFVSYAPAADPEIVVAVINEHGGWGASAAAPTAAKIIEGYFKLKKEDDEAAQKLALEGKPIPVLTSTLSPVQAPLVMRGPPPTPAPAPTPAPGPAASPEPPAPPSDTPEPPEALPPQESAPAQPEAQRSN
ncbi:MAG: penicillin-binding protein 2 [Deltaproteobacteria bacterium]|nr:penicillin-binding protein 2 [Deltaproteobacteria bacterium]